MMIPIEAEKYAEVKVVNKRALEEVTQAGWRLIGAIVEEGPHYEDVNGHVVQNYDNHVFKRLLFLVGRDKDTTVADLAAARDRLREEINETSDRLDVVQKELIARVSDTAIALAAGQKLAKELDTAEIQRKGLAKSLYQMEADLAKVRQAIGERTFKEIVG